jgi:DNA polymerase III subunit beta
VRPMPAAPADDTAAEETPEPVPGYLHLLMPVRLPG